MKFSEVLRRINFKIGTMDDVTGKSVNPIVSNRIIIDELNTQLQQYANITKGIEDIFSFPLNTQTPNVAAPSLALRSEAYKYIFIIKQGTIFPMDMRSPQDVFPRFRYNPVSGITNWIMPWGAGKNQYLTMFPMNNSSATATTLTADVAITATTLPVTSTAGYVANNGRLTIGTEKILYGYKDTTNFYDCIRGVEMTTAAVHASTSAVTENNVWLFYARLPIKIEISDSNFINTSVLNHEIEVTDEHIEGIIKAVAYNILIKIDAERALVYKMDYDSLYMQYKRDIMKGRYKGRQGAGVRQPFAGNEQGMPYGANLIY